MLIGIMGGSGAGKSTVSNYLEKKLNNAKCIRVDDIMKKNIEIIYKEEIEKAFDLKKLNPSFLFDSFEAINKWMNICKNNMNKELEELVNQYSKTYDYILADYLLLPMMDIWNKCDITVNVSSHVDVKVARLKQRLIDTNHIKKWSSDEKIINRIKSSDLNEHGYKSQYTIYNNGTFDELSKQIDRLLLKIQKN